MNRPSRLPASSPNEGAEVDLYANMLVALETVDVPGAYDEQTQTWTEEVEAQSSPVKHHQEN
jgi:hypothetical protein